MTVILAAALVVPGESELKVRISGVIAKSAAHYRALDAAATPLMKDAEGNLRTPHGFRREKGATYRAFAVRQLLSLSSDEYFSKGDEIGHFLLKHGMGHKPAGSEIDTPLDYGDYYFLEALLRFHNSTQPKH